MPRIKKRPVPADQSISAPAANGSTPALGEVLTLMEAAAHLRISASDVIGQVHSQGLPGRLIGGQWRFSKAAIQQWLATGSPDR